MLRTFEKYLRIHKTGADTVANQPISDKYCYRIENNRSINLFGKLVYWFLFDTSSSRIKNSFWKAQVLLQPYSIIFHLH